MKKIKGCGTLSYIGFGQERRCNKPAVAILDAGKKGEYPVCAECAKDCHPSRLTWLPKKADER